jgi:hypothetical protein
MSHNGRDYHDVLYKRAVSEEDVERELQPHLEEVGSTKRRIRQSLSGTFRQQQENLIVLPPLGSRIPTNHEPITYLLYWQIIS